MRKDGARNMKHYFIWGLAVLALMGLLELGGTSLAAEDGWTEKSEMPTAGSRRCLCTIVERILEN